MSKQEGIDMCMCVLKYRSRRNFSKQPNSNVIHIKWSVWLTLCAVNALQNNTPIDISIFSTLKV